MLGARVGMLPGWPKEVPMTRTRTLWIVTMAFGAGVFSRPAPSAPIVEEPVGPLVFPGASFQVDGRIALSALIALADHHVASMLDALELAAACGDAVSGEWERMKGLLEQVQRQGTPAAVWFARPDGSYFTVDKGLTGQNLKDRPYFPRLMAGETVMGELVVSRSTGKNSAVVAVPLRRGDDTIGALGASIYLDRLSEILQQELKLPAGMIFFALDDRGDTVLNSNPDRIFKYPAEQGNPALARAASEILAAPEGRTRYEFDGAVRDVIFQVSPLTGWRFALGLVLEE